MQDPSKRCAQPPPWRQDVSPRSLPFRKHVQWLSTAGRVSLPLTDSRVSIQPRLCTHTYTHGAEQHPSTITSTRTLRGNPIWNSVFADVIS